MEMIASIPLIGGLLSNVFPFIVALSVVVFIHEYGHYIVGRWCGIHARKFSVGFGPALISRTDRHGTVWQVAAIPLGGMVQFLGDADGASRADKEALADMDPALLEKTFHGAAVWRRFLTVAAGPVFNFVLSMVLFAGLALALGVARDDARIGEVTQVDGLENPLQTGDLVVAFNGEQVQDYAELTEMIRAMEAPAPIDLTVERDGDRLDFTAPYPFAPLIVVVQPFSAASKSDLQIGDLITHVNGQEIASSSQLLQAVDTSEGNTLALQILREGEVINMDLTPETMAVETEDGGYAERYRIGISLTSLMLPATRTPGVLEALSVGVSEVMRVITGSLNGIKHMILGDIGVDNLQGPIGIAQVSGESAKLGFAQFISFVAIISTAIGLLNLFPIPVLDGGHLTMFTYEALTGRQLSERVLNVIMPVGLAMVLLLMLFATYNDLIRLAASLTS